MTDEGGGSVTRWIGELKAGEPDAAQRLWERYFADLVRLAALASARCLARRRTRRTSR